MIPGLQISAAFLGATLFYVSFGSFVMKYARKTRWAVLLLLNILLVGFCYLFHTNRKAITHRTRRSFRISLFCARQSRLHHTRLETQVIFLLGAESNLVNPTGRRRRIESIPIERLSRACLPSDTVSDSNFLRHAIELPLYSGRRSDIWLSKLPR